MQGWERLAAVDESTPPMREMFPELPMEQTVMVRLLRICVVGMGQYFAPVFREIGLTESSMHALCLLGAKPGGSASPSELSDLVGASRANMSRIIETLAGDGLVVRLSEADDARRATVRITGKGREAAAAATVQLADPLKLAFSDLTPDEFARLAGLLRKVSHSFDKPFVDRGVGEWQASA